MRVCIIYDTKRRSTELFAKWIKEAFEENGEVVDIFKVNEFNGDFSYICLLLARLFTTKNL